MIAGYEGLLRLISTMRRPGSSVGAAARLAAEGDIGTVVGFILHAARKENDEVRCEALDLLSRLIPPLAVKMTFEFFQDPNPAVRRVACEVLLEIGDSYSELTILQHLESESDSEVRFAAIQAFRRSRYD